MRSLLLWRICCGSFLALSAVAFTPLVIPAGIATPYVLGTPRTLWAGVLLSISLLIVILLGSWASGTPRDGGES